MTCGVLVEAVPFARPRARFTRAFETTVAWLATRTDQTAISAFMRIDWDTVGRICERVVADELDPGRLDDLVEIGVDEISWRKHHNYLTLVVDHRTGTVVWGAEGKDSATLDKFFDDLGQQRSAELLPFHDTTAFPDVIMDRNVTSTSSWPACSHENSKIIVVEARC